MSNRLHLVERIATENRRERLNPPKAVSFNELRRRREWAETKKFGGPITRPKKKKSKAKKPFPAPQIRAYPEIPKYRPGMGPEFYQTREWRALRWSVLVKDGAKCCMCGRSRESGTVIHVDHIRPRKTHPTLELSKENLQVLCEDCNIGKGATTFKV